jgi:hypothetical protein
MDRRFSLRILHSPILWCTALCCTALAFASGILLASEQDPKTVLLEVRQRVLLSLDRLPKYMCTQTVDRVTYVPKEETAKQMCGERVSGKSDRRRLRKYTADRLRLDVTISGEGEIYSWAGEKRFQEKSLADLVHSGATSTGAFASFLRSIFAGNAATFTFNGKVHRAGADLMEFGFDLRSSAAGDIFKSVLARPLRNNGNTLLPKGAAVQGRILMFERAYVGPWETLRLGLALESVERSNSQQPFFGKLDSTVKKRAQVPVGLESGLRVRPNLGTFEEMLDVPDSHSGILTFEDVTDDFVIKPGMQATGMTTIAR